MANKNNEFHYHRGKGLMLAGLVLTLIGLLRLYNVEWPTVLIIVGALMIVKGAIIKSMKE